MDINRLIKKAQEEYSKEIDRKILEGIKRKGIYFDDISELNGRLGVSIQPDRSVYSIDNIDFLEELRGEIKRPGFNVSMEYNYRFL